MEQERRLDYLLDCLFDEYKGQGNVTMPKNYNEKRALFRALVNVRLPLPISKNFLNVQDDFLKEEVQQKGIAGLDKIALCLTNDRISLWQGDITRLAVDAIVNAANSKLLGCFVPGHSCIDNAIHTFAGIQLRQSCYELMRKQKYDEPTGAVKITSAYNLPCRYVLHTVGPIIHEGLTQAHCDELANCYLSCLTIAEEQGLESIAFCCISTGEFRFPKQAAAEIAVQTVKEFLSCNEGVKRVIFNVFKNEDLLIYRNLLNVNH